MKTVRRRIPGKTAPRRRKVAIVEQELDPKLRASKPEREVGVPAATTWLTLEEKQRRAERLAKRRPSPALDPKLDGAALQYLAAGLRTLDATGWRRQGDTGPGITIGAAIAAAGGADAGPVWRAFYLLEQAIAELEPLPGPASRGVLWLNERGAAEIARIAGQVLARRREGIAA
jgi:hypothetical protein